MIDANKVDSLIGVDVIDNGDRKVGTVGQVYVDSESNQPTWVTINTGLFGLSESFAPLDHADFTGGVLRVAFEKSFVKDAPRVDNDGALDSTDEDALYEYYSMGQNAGRSGADADDRDGVQGPGGTIGRDGQLDNDPARSGNGIIGNDPANDRDRDRDRDNFGAGHDTSGRNTDDAMTRSEEQLRVGTERVATGRARLRKHVVTENQTVTVPVSREEVRLEREPITDANVGQAHTGADLSDEEHEVQLTEERIVVDKQTVPVERVRLGTETVTENQQVTEEVRKEEIDYDGANLDGNTGRSRDDRN